MNIIEAISDSLTEVTSLTSNYIGRIYIDGTVKYMKPVDVRINRISIPLTNSDINFIYDDTNIQKHIHKCDTYLDTYFPQGAEFTLVDGGKLKLISYGSIKEYNNMIYVDMYCTLQNEGYYLVETINNNQIEDRVKFELNKIVESNEIVKGLLPQYDSNWLKFSDEDIDAIEKFNAMNVLSIFNKLEHDELYYYMSSLNGMVSTDYSTLPESSINMVKEISEISIYDRIKTGFLSYDSTYNPRYVFEGLIYMYENMILSDESLYDEFYLLNKLNQKCTLKITKNKSTISIYFNTPNECKNNYRLNINNYLLYGDYTKYNIESIDLFQINKQDLTEIKIDNVSTDQSDYLKVCTEIFSILSASNYENMTLSEYYDSVETLLNDIKTIDDTFNEEEEGEE